MNRYFTACYISLLQYDYYYYYSLTECHGVLVSNIVYKYDLLGVVVLLLRVDEEIPIRVVAASRTGGSRKTRGS